MDGYKLHALLCLGLGLHAQLQKIRKFSYRRTLKDDGKADGKKNDVENRVLVIDARRRRVGSQNDGHGSTYAAPA